MLLCNGELPIECSRPEIINDGVTQSVTFYISSDIPPETVKRLFVGDTFYFHDEALGGELPDTDNKKTVNLRITYNIGLIHKIAIKLK